MFNFDEMLFSLREFEHYFSETILKKGLVLFEQNNVQLLTERKSNERFFQVATARLQIHRRGEKVFSYSCSCSRSFFCEHLAAVAFFLQKDIFQGKSSKKKEKEEGPSTIFEICLTQTTHKELRKFFKSSEQNTSDIKKLFKDRHAGDLELYCLFWGTVFKPYVDIGILDDTLIHQMAHQIKKIKTEHSGSGNRERSTLLELSLLLELHLVFNCRFTGNERELVLLQDQLKDSLSAAFLRGLTEKTKEIWKRALIVCLEETSSFMPQTTLFLLPRALQLTKSRSFFSELTVSLEKKKYRRAYGDAFDYLLMAKWMLYIQRKRVHRESFPATFSVNDLEYTLALSELQYCSGKVEKSVQTLLQRYNTWSHGEKARQPNFRDYLLNRAIQAGSKDLELRVLKEAILYDLYIQPARLERFFSLIPAKEKSVEISDMILRLRLETIPLAQDKLNTLLFESGRFSELILELKKQGNSFLLLHKVLLKKWPDFEHTDLEIYEQQLMQAFNQRRVFHKPEDLFRFAMAYIGKLPGKERNYTKEAVLSKLGGKSLIHQFVNGLFDELGDN